MSVLLEPWFLISAAFVLAVLVQVLGRWADRRAATASAARVAQALERLRADDVDAAYRHWLGVFPEIDRRRCRG